MQQRFQVNGDEIVLTIEPEGDGWCVGLPDETEHRIGAFRLPGDILQISQTPSGARSGDNSSVQMARIPFARTEQGVAFSYQGQTYLFSPPSERKPGGRAKTASGSLIAPMVGVVADVLVVEGQPVEAYQPLVAIEAMKVIATLDAPFAGIVRKIYVQKSQRVEHGAPLLDVVPAETSPEPTS